MSFFLNCIFYLLKPSCVTNAVYNHSVHFNKTYIAVNGERHINCPQGANSVHICGRFPHIAMKMLRNFLKLFLVFHVLFFFF